MSWEDTRFVFSLCRIHTEPDMSWSITVNGLQDYPGFPLDIQESFCSSHSSYVRDAEFALALAKALGLKSATLSGMRSPNPYGGDEIVDVNVKGTPIYTDFLTEMSEIIRQGPGVDSDMAKHFAALAKLRAHPCSHVFAEIDQRIKRCQGCGVFLNGTVLYFEEGTNE